MLDLLIALKDEKAGLWYTPFNARNEAEAVRSFGEALRDPQGMVGRYPADFGLYRVGSWDRETGYIGVDEPTLICTGDALLRRIAAETQRVEQSQADIFTSQEG